VGLGLRGSISYSVAGGLAGGIGFGVLDVIRGAFGKGDPIGLSMARARDADNPYQPSSAIVPALAQAAAQQAQAKILGQGTRPDQTSVPQPIPQTFAAVGEQKLEPLVKEGTQSMSLDLGNLLGNLGSQYISARYGGPKAPQVMAPTIVAQGPQAGIAPTPALAGPNLMELGQEGYDYFFGDTTAPKKVTIDPVTGRICKKQRRRRKRLATTSDIKDLAALKSVLSPADLKTWIATHPS